ncbi:MAG: alpha/beta hydrolase [Polyangiales bacterium]
MRLLAVLGFLATLTTACSDSPNEAPERDDDRDPSVAPRDDGGAADGARGAADGAAQNAEPGGKTPAQLPPAEIRFRSCNGGFECGKLTVARDYADPAAGTIELGVMRYRARGQRIGALLINPGGPGGSAIGFLPGFAAVASSLGQRFDLVAFDPRGVGQSTPINCHDTLQAYVAADPTPDDAAEWRAVDDASKRFADDCAEKHRGLLPHLGTPNVARDMDRVREALGEETISYLGYSYGTAIGAWYAALFPKRVRAMVLDGAVDMDLSAVDLALEQGRGFEDALESYFAWCTSGLFRCAWTGGQTPAMAFARLTAQADRAPLRANGADRPAGPGEFTLGVIATLYGGEAGWQTLSTTLEAAAAGEGTQLVRLSDGYLDRRDDGSYSNVVETNNAVNCLDKPTPDAAALEAELPRFQREAPLFGAATLTGLLVCSHWPATQSETKLPPPAGAPPIVVIGTTGDPATPYAWAGALAEQVGTGVLLTYEGEGHTAYGRGVPCVEAAVNAYFINGTVPAAGTRCRDSLFSEVRDEPLLLRFSPGGR